MPKFPVVSGKKALDILIRHFGCQRGKQKGSHVPVTRRTSAGEFGSSVPMHKEIDKGTLFGILRDLQISPQEFADHV